MKNLVLITNFFPAVGKENFLIEEIPSLANKFQNVFIYPLNNSNNYSLLPENVAVSKALSQPIRKVEKISFLLKNCLLVLRLAGLNIFATKGALLLKFGVLAKRLQVEMADENLDSTLFYTYWLDEGATILGLLKSKLPSISILSRAHGYDLYEEDYPQGLPEFYTYTIDKLNEISFISKDGLEYFKNKYPLNKSLKSLFYLGTNDLGLANFPKQNEIFKIVTCSSIIPLKRLTFLAKALCKLEINLEWHHFGIGPEEEEVKKVVSGKEYIKLILHGFVNNKDLLEKYKVSKYHLFINVSRTEGLPVSLIEAASFGIPLLATNVRGTKEVCNINTGVLVDKNINEIELAFEIEKALKKSWDRESIRAYWKEHFNSNVNFDNFANYLVEK